MFHPPTSWGPVCLDQHGTPAAGPGDVAKSSGPAVASLYRTQVQSLR